MHEHIARTMYYFSVHLLYASGVGAAAWVLTSIRGASATTKYWIWVVTAFNFIVPIGAAVDKLWGLHLRWAAPLGALGGPIWDMTQGRTAVVLAAIWIAGALTMLVRLISRLRRERSRGRNRAGLSVDGTASGFHDRWHPGELRCHGIPLPQSVAFFTHVSCFPSASIGYLINVSSTLCCFTKLPTPEGATI